MDHGVLGTHYNYVDGSFDANVGTTFYIPEKEESHSLGRYGTELTTYPEKDVERKVGIPFNGLNKQITENTWITPDSLDRAWLLL